MNWITLVLIATVLWAIMAIIHKFVRVKYFEGSLGYLIFITPTILYAGILLFFEPLKILPLKQALFAISTGVLVVLGGYFYLESIHKEELSKISILFGIGPLFTLVLATIFLKEALTINQYIAFTLIFIGSTLISFKKVEQKIRLTAGAKLVLISAFFFSVYSIILKYLSELNLTTIMFYRSFGYFLSVFVIFLISPKVRKNTRKVVKDLNMKKTALVYGAEILGMTGLFFSYLAIQQGPVSLVIVLRRFQTILILIFALMISYFFPKILKEEMNKKTITIKIISITLMLGGLYLISV